MLVTIEGLDGSGKTTVCERLEAVYPDATLTQEPTRSWYGEAVRRSMQTDDADPVAELFLYTADHAAHLSRVVEPALAADKLVISDRYVDSRCAYQGATLADTLADPIAYIKELHAPITRQPDLTLYLDLAPETAVERTDQADKFERLEYLQAVQDNYERLIAAEPTRFVRLDATTSPADLCEQATAAIEERL